MNTNTAPMTTAELIQRAKAAAAAKAEREKQERAAAELAKAERAAAKTETPAKAEKPAAASPAFADPYADMMRRLSGVDALDCLTAVNAWTDRARLTAELETLASSTGAQEGEEETLLAIAEAAAAVEEADATLSGLEIDPEAIRAICKAQDAANAPMRGKLDHDNQGQSHLAGHVIGGNWATMNTAALDALLIVRVSVFCDKNNQLNPEKMHAALSAAGWDMSGDEKENKHPHRRAVAACEYLRSFKPDEKTPSFYTVVSFTNPDTGAQEPMPIKAVDAILMRGLLSGWIAPQWGDLCAVIDAEKQPAKRGRKPGSKNGSGKAGKKAGPTLSALASLL